MTPAKLTERLEAIENAMKEKYETAKALYSSGDYHYNNYKLVHEMLKSASVESSDINYLSLSELEKEIASFKLEVTNANLIVTDTHEPEVVAEVWGESVDQVVLELTGYVVIDQRLFDSKVVSTKRTEVAKLLKPPKASWAQSPDCKILGLFFEGTITWEALQKLTYDDCGL